MGRRGRRRAAQDGGGATDDGGGRDELRAPASDYTDEQGNVLTLRGSLDGGHARAVCQHARGQPTFA